MTTNNNSNKTLKIQIQPDNYAYITSESSKLLNTIKAYYTRNTRVYDNYWHKWREKQNKHYTVLKNGTQLKVKAGTVDFLTETLRVHGIKYVLDDQRQMAKYSAGFTTRLNDKVELRQYQKEAVLAALKARYCCVQLPTGSGKEQPISAKVLTPKGFVNIGDICVGDEIIAGDGRVTNVIGKYPQGVKDVYKIIFSDDSVAECGLEHIWTVSEGRKKAPNFQNITLSRILEKQKLNTDYGGRAREWIYEIPIAAVEGETKNFYIKPYTLGVLIADGCINGKEIGFSCSDIDVQIAERVKNELQDTFRLSKNSLLPCPQYKIVHTNNHFAVNEYRQEIIRLGLDVKSKDKFIPKEYLYGSSYQQREELLQGLLDCDGTQAKTKASTNYCTTSLRLAEDVKELVQSLGGISKISVQDRRHEGKPVEYNVRVQISNFCPFHLQRKAQYWRVSSDKVRRYIKRIEKVRQEESVCIEVESETKQYLTNNYIVTHNTEVAASIVKTYLTTNFNRAVLYVVPTIKLQKEAEERFSQYGIMCNTKLPILSGYVNIITYMSLVRTNIMNIDRDKVGAMVLDEMQHLKGTKASKIVHGYKKLGMIVGLSATITPDIQYKKDITDLNNDDFSIIGSTGKPVYYKAINETIEEKFVTPVEITVLENPERVVLSDDVAGDWHTIRREVLMSPFRLNMIGQFVEYICDQKNFNTVMLLIPEVEWSKNCMLEVAKYNSEGARIILMFGNNRFSEIINGEIIELKTNEQKEEAYNAIKNPNIKTIFSATSFAYEGMNVVNMQALINVYGGRSVTRIKQQLGRVMRLFEGKDMAYIYEIFDRNPVLKSQLKARLDIYDSEYHARVLKSKFKVTADEDMF